MLRKIALNRGIERVAILREDVTEENMFELVRGEQNNLHGSEM